MGRRKTVNLYMDDSEEIESKENNVSSVQEIPTLSEINKIQSEFYQENYGFEPEPYKNQNEFFNMDLNILKEYYHKKHGKASNIPLWNSGIASKDAIILDFKNADLSIASPILKYNIIPRTTLGHAQAGHNTFSTSSGKNPNTALEDIIADDTIVNLLNESGKSVYLSSEAYLKESHNIGLSITKMFEKALNSYEEYFYLTDENGKTLFGIEILKNLKLSTQAFLKGGIFGGKFDNYPEIRKTAEEKFNLYYGGGEAYLLNRDLAKFYGISLDDFTEQNYNDYLINFFMTHEHRLELFKKLNVVVENSNIDYGIYDTWENLVKNEGILMTSPEIKNKFIQQYIRIQKGRGGSDDTLIGLASIIDIDKDSKYKEPEYVFAKRLGAQLIDTMDTIEKSTLYFLAGGHDEGFARFLEKKWLEKARKDDKYRKVHKINSKELEREDYALVDKNQIMRLTALGINPNSAPLHSSTRYFLKVQNLESTGTNSLEQEMLYLQKKFLDLNIDMTHKGNLFVPGKLSQNPSEIKIGFHRQPFDFFKAYFDRAFNIAFEMYKLPEDCRNEFLSEKIRKKAA